MCVYMFTADTCSYHKQSTLCSPVVGGSEVVEVDVFPLLHSALATIEDLTRDGKYGRGVEGREEREEGKGERGERREVRGGMKGCGVCEKLHVRVHVHIYICI